MWTPLGDLHISTKHKLLCRCLCGVEREVRVREILAGKSNCCRSCAARLKMQRLPPDKRIAIAKAASYAAAVAVRAKAKADPLRIKFGDTVDIVRRLGVGAKQRCTNPNCPHYANYGGRSIEFRFPTTRAFVEWVLHNIGPRPSPAHSLDRIDNSRHYEPGNLRWATRSEQARNKRAYKRTANGERIRALHTLRPDLTYETLRTWIKQGATDEQILQREKYARTSV